VRIAVDTNVLVRYLTWDDEAQAIEAANAIEGADTIVVPTIVLCELVWVLKRAYRYAGPEIIQILRRLAAVRAVEIERPAAEAGIAMLERGGDFADGVVRYDADRAKCDRLVTLTRASRGSSVQTRLRFWELRPRRDQTGQVLQG
jgi:predicted nucleic-acid-binding protein